MGAAVVVFVGEGVELGLELGQGCGSGLAGEPAFEGLVESFDFAAGGGVIGGGVDLAHAQTVQLGFVLVAAAFAAGESGGEDHAVVGEGGVRDAVFGNGFGEFVGDGGAGDVGVGGDGECVAGVVVDPAQDFGVGAVGEVPVGVVGLPALVGLFGGKADVGRFGSFVGAGCDESSCAEVAADGGDGNAGFVVVSQVPGDGMGSGVESCVGQGVA